MNNVKVKNNMFTSMTVILIVLVIFGIDCFYKFFGYVLAFISGYAPQSIVNITVILGLFIGVYFSILVLYGVFIKKISVKASLINHFVLGGLSLVSLILFIVNYAYIGKVFSGLFTNQYYDKSFFSGFCIMILLVTYSTCYFVTHYRAKIELPEVLASFGPVNNHNGKLAVPIIILGLFFFYNVGGAFVFGLFTLPTHNVLAYFFVLEILLVCIFDYIWFLLNTNKNRFILNVVGISLNVLTIVLFIIYESLNYGILFSVLKPIAPLDNALAYDIYPVLLIIHVGLALAFGIFKLIKNLKSKKQTEQTN